VNIGLRQLPRECDPLGRVFVPVRAPLGLLEGHGTPLSGDILPLIEVEGDEEVVLRGHRVRGWLLHDAHVQQVLPTHVLIVALAFGFRFLGLLLNGEEKKLSIIVGNSSILKMFPRKGKKRHAFHKGKFAGPLRPANWEVLNQHSRHPTPESSLVHSPPDRRTSALFSCVFLSIWVSECPQKKQNQH